MLKIKISMVLLILFGFKYAVALEFIVNTTDDTVDANIIDGLCADAAGLCSLRAAIMQTNQFSSEDTIYLPRNGFYKLSLVDDIDTERVNDLDIRDDLLISIENPEDPILSIDELPVITSDGAVVFNDRIFDLQAGAEIEFYGIGIVRGDALFSSTNARKGGGIYVSSNVRFFRLTESYVILNEAGFGAGIYSAAEFTVIKNSDISYNTLIIPSNALDGAGGAGIYHVGDYLGLGNSSIHHNQLDSDTGFILSAIALNGVNSDTSMTNTLIADNGVLVGSFESVMDGISANNSNLRLNNSNITGNTRTGIRFRTSSDHEFKLRNSVLSDNLHANCDNLQGDLNFGSNANKGSNVSSDLTCQLPANSNNREGVDSRLSQLSGVKISGVITEIELFVSQYPMGGSVLIDRGSVDPTGGGTFFDSCVETDIRGVIRPQDGGSSVRCDIGAYELDDVIFTNGFAALAQ